MPILAKEMEMRIPTRADFKKARKKPGLKPTLISTIMKAMGTEIITAARQDMSTPAYFF